MRRVLIAILLATVTLVGCSAAPGAGSSGSSGKTTLTASEFKALIAQPGVQVIDVRTPAEFASGHLAGATNIDIEASDFDARVGQLSRSGSYALYCRSGNRSGQALARMTSAGFSTVAHLGGGIGAWQAAGYPVVT